MSNHNLVEILVENSIETTCYDEDIHNKYAYILETNNKDKNIEYFWFGFKTSIVNFIIFSNNQKYLHFIKYINEKSYQMNNLQQQAKFNQIETEIKKIMIKYGFYLLKSLNFYHLSIYNTNIKRWNIVCQEANKLDLVVYQNKNNRIIEIDPNENDEKTINSIKLNNQLLIFLYIYIKTCINNSKCYKKFNQKNNQKNKQFNSQIYDIFKQIKYNDYDHHYLLNLMYKILDLCFKYQKPGFIEKIKIQIDIYSYIEKKYNIKFKPPISVSKMFKKMKQKKLI